MKVIDVYKLHILENCTLNTTIDFPNDLQSSLKHETTVEEVPRDTGTVGLDITYITCIRILNSLGGEYSVNLIILTIQHMKWIIGTFGHSVR